MKLINNLKEVTKEDLGKFIRLGGMGITDGLKGEACKMECFKIIDVDLEVPHITPFKLFVKGYRRTHYNSVSGIYSAQKAEIYTPAEFKKLPTKWRGTK